MESVPIGNHPAGSWLRAFAQAVRERDYEAARQLFSEGATGFGTVSSRYAGLEQLEQHQWIPVWDRTEGFEFDLDSAVMWTGGALVAVSAEWSSVGVDPGAGRRHRRGRATIVLADLNGELTALHTHFSMAPGSVA